MTGAVILNSRAAKIWFVLDRGLTFFVSHYSFITARLIFKTSYTIFILKKSIVALLINGLKYYNNVFTHKTAVFSCNKWDTIDSVTPYQLLLFIFKGKVCCTINKEIRDKPAVKKILITYSNTFFSNSYYNDFKIIFLTSLLP